MTKEERKIYNKNYYKNNKIKICAVINEYRVKNIESIKEKKKLAAQLNKDNIAIYQKYYRETNSDKLKKNDIDRNSTSKRVMLRKTYNLSEKGKVQRRKTRKLTISDKWRSMLHNVIKRLGTKKEVSTHQLLGYSALELKNHIEGLFIEGMTWDNHGEWHIDHIMPVSRFSPCTLPSVVSALSNLQPLWWLDNLKKGCKII